MKAARVGGLLARGLIAGLAAVIVVVAALLTWPWTATGPSADDRRLADLQRLSHAIEVFRAKHDILPASLGRLPNDPAAPIHTYDPVTNRLYDYRPLGPLAYELCARFDAARMDEPRDFWWHDAGRHCFALETRSTSRPKPAAAPASTPAPARPAAAPADAPAAAPPAPPS